MNTYNPQNINQQQEIFNLNDSYFKDNETVNVLEAGKSSQEDEKSSTSFSSKKYKFSNDFDDDDEEVDPNDYYRRKKLYWDIMDL